MVDTFYKDLPIGEEQEYKVLDIIQKKYPNAYKIEGNFKEYDIYVPEINTKIEVKKDIGSSKSNNYFIEYECNGELSGISTTTADYWVICDETNYIWIKRNKLITVASWYGKHWEGIPNGGASLVKAYLVPKDNIKIYAKGITKLPVSLN